MPQNSSPLFRLLRWSEKYTKTDMMYLASIGWWMNLGFIFTSIFSLMLYIAFSRLLPKDVYGTYRYLLSIGSIISAFTLTGMNSAVARAIARGFEAELKRSIVYQFKWGLLPLMVGWIAGAYYLLHGNTTLGIGLFLLGMFVPFNNAFNTYGVFVSAKKDFQRGFVYTIWWNALYIGTLVVTALLWKSALALLIANLLSQAVGLSMIYIHLIKTYRPSGAVNTETLPYGMHLSIIGFIGVATAQADNIMTFHFLGPSALAIYSFATAIPENLSGFFKFLSSATLLKLSTKESSDISSVLRRQLVWVLFPVLALIGLYVLLAPTLFKLLFGQYLDAVSYSSLYSLVILAVFSDILIAALTATRQVSGLYWIKSSAAVIQLLLQLAGIIYWGLWGLVVAKIISSFIPGILTLIFISHLRISDTTTT